MVALSERERRTRPQRGPRANGVAEGVAAAVRRRQRDRGPRVTLYDELGHARAIAPSAPGYDELLVLADRMLAELPMSGRRR